MLIAPTRLEARIAEVLAARGAIPAQASATARHLTWCEMVGRRNFGIERLPILLRRVAAGVLNPRAIVLDEQLAPSLVRCDGGGGFGFHAAEHAMTLALAMAGRHGIGAAAVRNSNFFGAGAYYVNQAAAAGMVGLAMSNSFPKVVAHGGTKPVLGTNPMAFGAPGPGGDHLLFDMATSALAGSTVREHVASGLPLPKGLAIDGSGQPITDPAKVMDGALLPMGGAKGFGLALMVEILAGVLAGAGFGSGVASMYGDFTRSGDNGHFLLALDISRFMDRDEFLVRFSALALMLKGSGESVLLPGELRWQNYRRALTEGIEIDEQSWEELATLGP